MSTKLVHVTSVHPRHDVRIFHKQCRSLSKAGLDVVLIVQDGRGDELCLGVRIVDMGRPPSGRLLRILKSPWRAWGKIRQLEADIIHFHDSELLPMAYVLKKQGRRMIYDAHEDVPRDILSKHWVPLPLRRSLAFVAEKIENFVVRRLDGVVTATPFIARRFACINSRC